jgi:starvation-inducible DNA-binding protein
MLRDIAQNTRNAAIELLQARLSDALDLASQIKQAHWTIKGSGFIALHELLDRLNDEVLEHADTIAERIAVLDGHPEGTVRATAGRTTLCEYPAGVVAQSEHVTLLSTQILAAATDARRAIRQADEIGEADAADIFTAYSRALDKALWLVASHEPPTAEGAPR